MAETKKTTETKTVKSSETKAAPKTTAAKKTTATKAAAKPAAPKTTVKAAAPKAEVKAAEVVEEKAVKVAPKAKKGDMLKVTLVKSGSGRLIKQKRTLEALGLRKTNSSNIVPDNAATRGMIFVVKHLVSVEKV